jgi:hypothetical protein
MVTATGVLERRDLVALETRLLQVPEGELVGRKLFHNNTSINPGAESYGYDIMTRTGVAKFIANGSTELPLVDVDFTRAFNPLVSIGAGAQWTLQELRAASMAHVPINAAKIDTVRRAMSEKEDKLIFVGAPELGIKGITNAEGIQVVPSSAKWSTMTPEKIVDQIGSARKLAKKMPGFEQASYVLILPTDQFEDISRIRYNDYEPKTILQIIQGYNWFTQIISTQAMSGTGDGGSDAALIANNADDVCEILVASDVTLLQQENYSLFTKQGAEARVGGAAVRIPYQFVRIDGI